MQHLHHSHLSVSYNYSLYHLSICCNMHTTLTGLSPTTTAYITCQMVAALTQLSPDCLPQPQPISRVDWLQHTHHTRLSPTTTACIPVDWLQHSHHSHQTVSYNNSLYHVLIGCNIHTTLICLSPTTTACITYPLVAAFTPLSSVSLLQLQPVSPGDWLQHSHHSHQTVSYNNSLYHLSIGCNITPLLPDCLPQLQPISPVDWLQHTHHTHLSVSYNYSLHHLSIGCNIHTTLICLLQLQHVSQKGVMSVCCKMYKTCLAAEHVVQNIVTM